MPFLDSILEKIGFIRKEKAIPPAIASTGAADPFTLWASRKKIAPEKALEVYAGWVYACIRAIAEELGSMQLRLFQVKPDGDEEIFDHELLDLLYAVNPSQTGLELKYLTGIHLESVGNAFWFLDGVSSETDQPTAIHILNPARVKVIINRDQFPTQITGYQYRQGTQTYQFQPYQILHLKYPDPTDPFEGIGTVQAVAQWIDADNYAMEFNRRFFLNGARLGGFLESESAYTTEQLEFLKKSFESIYKGVENAYRVAALPKGTTFKASSETQKDMDFANLMTVMRDRILAGFRVPRTALGITDDVNRANAEATNYVFALRTIKPKMALIVSYLNEFLVPRYGKDLYLDFVDPVPENREQRVAEMAAALGQQPALSVNEAREQYFGLGPIDNGEAVMTDFSKQPLGAPKPKAASRQTQKRGRPQATHHAKAARKRQELSQAAAEKVAAAAEQILTTAAELKKKNITTLSDEEYEVLWKGFITRVTPYEKALTAAVRKFNRDQNAEVQANLSSAITSKAIDRAALFNKEEAVGVLVNLTTPILTDLMAKEGTAAAGLLGLEELDILTPEVRTALGRSIELLAAKYNDTTLDLLAQKLAKGQAEGLSLDELKDLVAQIYDFSDDVRAEQVARTETFRIANAATHEAWQQSGLVKTMKWYTAADERVCPYCDPMHGKVVGIDSGFFKKGDTVTGSDGSKLDLDYDDVDYPPLHVQCRCYLRPEEISLE